MSYYRVRARMQVLDRNFKEAENIYLEQNSVDEAIEMYQVRNCSHHQVDF